MKKINFIKGCLALFSLWMCTFFVFRLLFVYRHFDQIENIKSIFKFGFGSDISTASIIVSTSICILLFSHKRNNQKTTFTSFKIYSLALAALIIIIEYSSLILYTEWGSTVSYKAISYLSNGINGWTSVIRSIDFYIIIYALLGVTFFKTLNRILQLFFTSVSNHIVRSKSQYTI